MESPAAALSAPYGLTERIEPLGVWLFGFLLVALLAGSDGGFFPAAWAWAAFSTWLWQRRSWPPGRVSLWGPST